MTAKAPLFAHGSPAAPIIVATFERALQHALDDATRRGQPQAVLAVDIHHPERPIVILGYAYPDGTYEKDQ